jgi:hypothetical protein
MTSSGDHRSTGFGDHRPGPGWTRGSGRSPLSQLRPAALRAVDEQRLNRLNGYLQCCTSTLHLSIEFNNRISQVHLRREESEDARHEEVATVKPKAESRSGMRRR